jgi:CheY-like chemotaxis protein
MKRILVVDDEPHVIRVLSLTLERAGYRVESAPNGEVALQRVLQCDVDAVVTDVQMPRMNGQELCERIQENLPGRDLPIYIMTSLVDQDVRDWARHVPNIEFLEKPLSPRLLVRTLDNRLSGNGEGA